MRWCVSWSPGTSWLSTYHKGYSNAPRFETALVAKRTPRYFRRAVSIRTTAGPAIRISNFEIGLRPPKCTRRPLRPVSHLRNGPLFRDPFSTERVNP